MAEFDQPPTSAHKNAQHRSEATHIHGQTTRPSREDTPRTVHFDSIPELQKAAAELPLHECKRFPAQATSFLGGLGAIVGLPALAERDKTTKKQSGA